MLETVPLYVWLGLGGGFGAACRGIFGYAKAVKNDSKVKFDIANFSDSIWQGVAVASAVGIFGMELPAQGLVIGFVSGWTGSSVGDKLKINLLKYTKEADLLVKKKIKK